VLLSVADDDLSLHSWGGELMEKEEGKEEEEEEEDLRQLEERIRLGAGICSCLS